ncbi:hypothetical protein VTH82DRAFT_3260 [Thermothelomyces myriococcoides]
MGPRDSLIRCLVAVIGLILILQGQLATAMPFQLDSASRFGLLTHTKQTSSAGVESWTVIRRTQLPGIKDLQASKHGADGTILISEVSGIAPTRTSRRNLATDGRQAAAAEGFPRQPVHRRELKLIGKNGTITTLFVLVIILAIVVAIGIISVVVYGPDWKRCFKRPKRWTSVAQEDSEGTR